MAQFSVRVGVCTVVADKEDRALSPMVRSGTMTSILTRCASACAAFASLASLVAVASCGGQNLPSPSAVRSAQLSAPRLAFPTASAAPIQLVPGTTVGTDVFPEGDTTTGGQGQTINGIRCAKDM